MHSFDFLIEAMPMSPGDAGTVMVVVRALDANKLCTNKSRGDAGTVMVVVRTLNANKICTFASSLSVTR